MDSVQLNARFGIKHQLKFKTGPGDLVIAEINLPAATATVALQGAQIWRWAPHGQADVIWLSPQARFAVGKSVRGGVPICWPWFGAHAHEQDFPAHGFARMSQWSLQSVEKNTDAIELVFTLAITAENQRLWPHATSVTYRMRIGAQLQLELATRNQSTQEIVLGEALHTYFAVGDVREVSVTGLDGVDYLDKVQDFKRFTQQGAVRITSEVDRVYLNTTSECVIHDPVLQRHIHITKQGSNTTVVWNPWQDKARQMGDMGDDGYLHMLCVESGNAAENVIHLAPGAEHRLQVSYLIDSD